MFRSVNEKSKSGAQPVAGDERVRKEAQFEEDLRSSGSAGNEDANVKFMEMLLDPGNKYGPREGRRGPIEQKEELLIDQIDGKFYGGNESFGNISFSSGKKAENDGFSFNDLIIPGPENGAGGAGDISSSEGKKPQKEDIKAAIEIAEDLQSGEDQKSVGSIDSNDPNFRIMEVLLDPANKYGPEDRHGPIEKKEEPLVDLLAGQFAGGNENFGDILPGPGEKEEKEEPKGSGNIMNDVPAKKPRRKNDEYLPLSTYAAEEDLVTLVPRGKGKKGKKKRRAENNNSENRLQGIEQVSKDARWKDAALKRFKDVHLNTKDPAEEAAFHAEEMEKLKNFDFAALKLGKIDKPGKWRRLLTYAASGMGKLLGLAMQVVTLGHFRRLKSTARFAFKRTDSWQANKDHRSIPGWNGAKFAADATSGDDVMADFRRVPTVWSRLTAAKAAETDSTGVEKPLDPVVSIMMQQPKKGSGQALNGGEMGHAMIGIEYSRKSAISGRYERYKVQYGFYPAGGITNFTAGTNMLKNGVAMPGQLGDDADHAYDVSRRYRAKPEQVSAIFQASEKYAEGGYSYYDRNCVTFVKQMVVDTAHLATGGEIFKQSEIALSGFANLGILGANVFDQNSKAGTENLLMDLSEKEDMSYQNYGNKRVTGRDWLNYKNSQKTGGSFKSTFSPGETAERMRRLEGDEAGEIGSYGFDDLLKNEAGVVMVGLASIDSAITKQGERIQELFQNIIPEETRENLPYELNLLINDMSGFGLPIYTLDNKIDNERTRQNEGKAEADQVSRQDFKEEYAVTPDEVRDAREQMSANIGKLNVLLNNYLKNDKRCHQPILDLISLLNHGIDYLDKLYRKVLRGGPDREEVTNMREEMTHSPIRVRTGGEEAIFTPTHYESYIQIYKDPAVAVAKYNRLLALREKKKDSSWASGGAGTMALLMQKAKSGLHLEDDDDMTLAELRELQKLERIDSLAKDFDRSHNYMIEKDSYDQQDIDYAFQLHKQETRGLEATEEAEDSKSSHENYVTASGIYISIFMDKFFHDMKETWVKDPDKGGIAEEDATNFPVAESWLDSYLSDRIKGKQRDFLMIVRGLYRSLKPNDPDQQVNVTEMFDELGKVVMEAVVNRQFAVSGGDLKVAGGYISLAAGAMQIVKKKNSEFYKQLKTMIRVCQMEDKDKTLTRINRPA